jgi:DNA-binding NarL/FixJ family response regulator
MLRILIADDHGIVRRGIRSLLESEAGIEVVGESADGLDAVRQCEALAPDVAIVDIAMPHLNGIEVTAQATKRNQALKVIVLSMYADETYIMRALAAGARSYLLKEATEADLLPAIRAVASGKSFFSPAISRVLLDDYVRQLQKRGLTDSWDLLTAREKEVLQLLAEGHTNREVAAKLNIGVSTVESHRNRVMHKLNFRHFADLVLYAVRKGLLAPKP